MSCWDCSDDSIRAASRMLDRMNAEARRKIRAADRELEMAGREPLPAALPDLYTPEENAERWAAWQYRCRCRDGVP
jgi:hypothetical protein